MSLSAAFLLVAGLPLLGQQVDIRPVRDVSILVLADEEVRSLADWRPRITSCMRAVSWEFERLFGIRLAIKGFADWLSDGAVQSLDLLLDAVDAGSERESCDTILALTAQKNLEPGMLGYSLYKEGIILARFDEGPPGLERVLKHEWGHIFGAAHVADRESIMNEFLQGMDFDSLNARAIRLNSARIFNGIDFPLPKEFRREATEIYRDICALNARARARARHSDLSPETTGVSVSRQPLPVLDDAFILLAQVHLEEKEYDLAQEACRAALNLNPNNLETRNLSGIISRRQGRIDEAIATYQGILKEKPRSPRYLYNMGIAHAKKGEVEAAMDLYRQAIELKPNFAEAWNNIGELSLRSGRLEDAEEALLRAVFLNGSFALARSNLAEVYVRKKEYDKSLAEVVLALRLHPDLPGPYNVRGNLLHQQGKTLEAVSEYQKAIAIDPGYEKAYYNLGLCLFKEGRFKEALVKLSKAVELAPRFAEAHASLGDVLLTLKEADAGIAEIRLAQELGLVDAKTHLNLSFAHLLKNDAGSAASEALRAIELDPSLAMAHNNLGVAYARSGMVREAEEAFRKAINLDPANKEACASLASLLTVLGKRDEALGFFLKAAALDPDDGNLHNNIAVLYYQQGSHAEAWDHAQKALALGGKVDPEFLKELKRVKKRPSAALIAD